MGPASSNIVSTVVALVVHFEDEEVLPAGDCVAIAGSTAATPLLNVIILPVLVAYGLPSMGCMASVRQMHGWCEQVRHSSAACLGPAQNGLWHCAMMAMRKHSL